MKENATIRRASMAANEAMHRLQPFEKLKAARDALGIPEEPPGQFWRVNRESILWFREFVKAGGLVLDPAFWRIDKGAAKAVSDAIENALTEGIDAYKAAALFMYGGLGNDVVYTQQYVEEYDEVALLFRSLINRCHGSSGMIGTEQTPGFGGFKYVLSPVQGEHNVSNLFAVQNLYGLGRGVYPSAAQCPWPAYPGTLSYTQVVFKDEVTARHRAGMETSMQALTRLPAKVRLGVLGQTKAKYFDAGLLKSWMIRSPLDSVQKRLARQGLIDGNALEKDPDPYEDGDDC